jgi:hypothetical protein
MITTTFLMAITAIRRNAMRSFLTTLGVIIGVASVIAMVTLGRGATASVTNDISALGNNLLIVAPGADRRFGSSSSAQPFNQNDVRAIREEVPAVSLVAPTSGGAARIVYGNQNWSTGVTGADNSYLRVRNWIVALGREFLEAEIRTGEAVCILGETPRRELFGAGDPLGEHIRVGTVSCEVIGVLESKGTSTFGEDQDDFIVMPLVTFQRRISGNDNIGAILVSATEGVPTRDAQLDLIALLRQRRRIHPGDEDDFVVRDMQEIGARRDRGGEPPRRRHRDHEHHDGRRDGADAGDRHPHGDRCARRRRAPAVPRRGDHALGARRRGGHRARPRRQLRGGAGLRPPVGARDRRRGGLVPLLRARGRLLRLLPRPQGRPAQPDRGAPL